MPDRFRARQLLDIRHAEGHVEVDFDEAEPGPLYVAARWAAITNCMS
jgi:hypothetical protein